jgi:hypothetical protein
MTDNPPSYDASRPKNPVISFPILNELCGKRVVLGITPFDTRIMIASASPRRKQLLAQMVKFTTEPRLTKGIHGYRDGAIRI